METNNIIRKKRISLAIEKYEKMLLKYAYNLTDNYTLAQDVVQDTFLKLCNADIEKVDTYLKAWLFKVCRNRALEILRKERRMSALTDQRIETTESREPSPYDRMKKDDSLSRITGMIDRLPEKQKEVIYLKFQHNLSYREISEITSLSVSNVGFILHTAIRQLRNQMTQEV